MNIFPHRGRSLSFVSILGMSFFLLLPLSAMGQQEVHPALRLCRAGKREQAVTALEIALKTKEYKANGEMWNCLGLARYNDDRDKDARKAFEMAVKLVPTSPIYKVNLAHLLLMNRKIDSAQSQLKKALEIDPKNPEALYLQAVSDSWERRIDDALVTADKLIRLHPADGRGYILKADLLVSKLGVTSSLANGKQDEAAMLGKAVDVLTEGKAKVTDQAGAKAIAEDLENKTVFKDYFLREKPVSATPDTPAPPELGATPLKVTSKQKAQYTDRARQANVQGTITLAVLFGSNGKILHILMMKRLGYGLDEQAVNAARQIKFEPEVKDGKPISVVRLVSFTFNIY